MPTFKVTIAIEEDGVPKEPIVKRVTVDEAQAFSYDKVGTSDSTFSAVPTGEIEVIRFLLLQTDKRVTLHLNGQPTAGVALDPGGLILLINTDLASGPATNVTVNNLSPPSVIALLRGLAGGT